MVALGAPWSLFRDCGLFISAVARGRHLAPKGKRLGNIEPHSALGNRRVTRTQAAFMAQLDQLYWAWHCDDGYSNRRWRVASGTGCDG